MHRNEISRFKIITILSIYTAYHIGTPDFSYAAHTKIKPTSFIPYTQAFNLPPPNSLSITYNSTSSSPQLFFEPINFLLLKNFLSTDVYIYILQTNNLKNNISHTLNDKKYSSISHHNPNQSPAFHAKGQPNYANTLIQTSTVIVNPGQKSVSVYKEKNISPTSNTANSYNYPYSKKIDIQTLSPVFEIETINQDLETTNLHKSLQIAEETLATSLPSIHHIKNFTQTKKNEIEMDDFPNPETYYEAILRLFHSNEDLDFD